MLHRRTIRLLERVVAAGFASWLVTAPGIARATGEHWKVTSLTNSFTNLIVTPTYSATTSGPGTDKPFNVGSPYSLSTSGSYHVVAVWVDAFGSPATTLPTGDAAKAYLKITASARWTLDSGAQYAAISSHSASNGLGDPEVPTSTSGRSAGSHYLRLDGSSGTVTKDIPMNAAVGLSGLGYGKYSVVCDLSAAIVTKGVILTAPDRDVIPTPGNAANKFYYDGNPAGQDPSHPALGSDNGGTTWVATFFGVADPTTYLNSTTFTSFRVGQDAGQAGTKAAGAGTISQPFLYVGLPAHNSDFGNKQVSVKVDGDLNITDTANVQVFFMAIANNHPDPDLAIYPGAPRTPNWYFYWSQTSANYGTHVYGGGVAGGGTGVTI